MMASDRLCNSNLVALITKGALLATIAAIDAESCACFAGIAGGPYVAFILYGISGDVDGFSGALGSGSAVRWRRTSGITRKRQGNRSAVSSR